MTISTIGLSTFKQSEECCGTLSIQSHSAPSSQSSSPILPPKVTIGLESQLHPRLKTLNEKNSKKTSVKGVTTVEKRGLESDYVIQKSLHYDSSLCRKCSTSHSNNTDSIQYERCSGWYCKLCSDIDEAFDILLCLVCSSVL